MSKRTANLQGEEEGGFAAAADEVCAVKLDQNEILKDAFLDVKASYNLYECFDLIFYHFKTIYFCRIRRLMFFSGILA